MANLDDVLAEIAYQGARIDALDVKVAALQKRVKDERAKAALTPEQLQQAEQAKIDKALADLQKNHAQLDKVFAAADAVK